jgi:N6-L-threonylcarbamoyladenine synthase
VGWGGTGGGSAGACSQIIPVIDEALNNAHIPPLTKGRWPKGGGVDAIAVASGPGLITSLMVGVETAKTLAYAWGVPLVSVNHIEAHIYANFISMKQEAGNPTSLSELRGASKLDFPAVVLTVSGGHTMLILMRGHGNLETLGETRDDAAGEAFDKGAKMMGLGYPGGPAISACAEKLKIKNEKLKIKLPRPMLNSSNFDFSFSGLKTALRYALEEDKNWKKRIPEYCYEYQQAIIDVLLHKTIKAAKKYNVKTVMLAGGVVANKELRRQFEERMKQDLPDTAYKIPDTLYTTDNAAMVATAGYYKAMAGKFTLWKELNTICNKKI